MPTTKTPKIPKRKNRWTITREEAEALALRAMEGGAAAERERWALVLDQLRMFADTAPHVTVSSALRVLAKRMRDNDGPKLDEESRARVITAAKKAAGVR